MSIDASASECVVVLFDTESAKFFEIKSEENNKHVESMFSLIIKVLEDAKLSYLDITHMVAIVGPGSFTGLRACLAAVQGFKLTTSISVHGVSLLEIQAYLKLSSTPKCDHREIFSVAETNRTGIVYQQKFDSRLFPMTNANLVSSDEIPDSGCIMYQHKSQLSPYTSAKVAVECLVYKLDNGIPDTPLVPIYSRSYI